MSSVSSQVRRRLAGSVPRARDSGSQRVSSGVGPTKKEKEEVLSSLMGHHRIGGVVHVWIDGVYAARVGHGWELGCCGGMHPG